VQRSRYIKRPSVHMYPSAPAAALATLDTVFGFCSPRGPESFPTPAFLPAPTERTPPSRTHDAAALPLQRQIQAPSPGSPLHPRPFPRPSSYISPLPHSGNIICSCLFLDCPARFPPLISLASLLLHARSSLSQVTGFFLDTPDCPLPHLQPFLFIFCSHLPPWVDHLLTNLSRLPPRTCLKTCHR